ELGTRYNASGEHPNNDFLRDDPGAPGGWRVFRDGPAETRALLARLEATDPPAAALDIHQDPAVAGPGVFAYFFGQRAPFRSLIAASLAHAPAAPGHRVRGEPRGALAADVVPDEGDRHDERHEAAAVVLDDRRQLPPVGAVERALEVARDVLQHVDVTADRGEPRERRRVALQVAGAELRPRDALRPGHEPAEARVRRGVVRHEQELLPGVEPDEVARGEAAVE